MEARILRRSLTAFLILGSLGVSTGALSARTGTTLDEGTAPGATHLDALPATFAGEFPCADCPGIFYQLDLFEDRLFFLRTTYLGRGAGAVRDEIGSWVFDSGDGRLALFGSAEAPVLFRIIDSKTIRKLDVEGREIRSDLNYDLRRKDDLPLIEPRVPMRGIYHSKADAAVFEECLSGRSFQVARAGDHAALEKASIDSRRGPGEALMVSLQGRIVHRPATEGDALVLTVVPERFTGAWPGETCGVRIATAELEDTYWKLTRLGNRPVLPGERQREPHLVLRSEDHRVSGFGGCNQIMGSYTVEGESISFSPVASTMMACAEGAETERAFFAALESVRSWRLAGQHLDFYDEAEELVARFEAVPRD